MSRRLVRGPATVHANLTPMIDVTFLLIVFFVLVSQIVDAEHVDLELPTLLEPASEVPGEELRAVVNVIPAPGGGIVGYRLGGTEYDASSAGRIAIVGELTRRVRANPGLRINLRADRSTDYEHVQPVLEAIGRAARRVTGAAPRVHLVIIPEDGS